jgi:hypothetical protein
MMQDAHRVAPDELPAYWVLDGSASDANVPNSGKNLHVPVCASASYTIGSDGVARDARLEKVVPDSSLGPTAVEIVSHFHYHAADGNVAQEPVRTYYTVQFNVRNLPTEEKNRLTAACTLPGYGKP